MTEIVVTEEVVEIVVEELAPTGVIETTTEVTVLAESTEVVLMEVTEQGPPGAPGASGFAIRRVPYLALTDGEQIITLPFVPTTGLPINVFINGLLHADVADYSVSSLLLTLTAVMGIAVGDQITIIYQ